METIKQSPVEFKETEEGDKTTYTWTKEGNEIAKVTASKLDSYRPKIEFKISENLVPYYEKDGINALDELKDLSMYKDIEFKTENGEVNGTIICSHNANLGVGIFVQSIKGWIDKT